MKAIYVDFEAWMAQKFRYECTSISQLELVGTFRTAKKALSYIKDHLVDVVFLDMKLPEFDGVTMAQRIREISPNTAIVFFSAFGDETEQELRAHDMKNPYVMKPYTSREIRSALSMAC